MKKLTEQVSLAVHAWNELSFLDRELYKHAIRARSNAQAPYSNYKVGCAVLSGDRIFRGVNVERGSWTQTTHAEQNAIDTMVTELGPSRISRIAIVGAPAGQEILLAPRPGYEPLTRVGQVCPSCGHCLQIIGENCFDKEGHFDKDVVIMGYHNGEFYLTTIGDAWPMPFPPEYLGVNYKEILMKR